MSTNAITFDLHALAEPKRIGDIIALGHELLDELDRLHAHVDAAIARCQAGSSAVAEAW